MQHFIASYGYIAIFLLMLAEGACVPIPSEVILPLGGALAAGAVAGTRLNIVVVILVGTAGNVAGGYIAWAAGRYVGLPALRRWGHRLLLRAGDLERAEVWFDRRGRAAVLIARLLPVVRSFVSLPAGAARMPALRFGVYTTIGCLPWSAALAAVGYAIGANWRTIDNAFHGPTVVVAVVVVVGIVCALAVYVWRRRHGSSVPDDPTEGTAASQEGTTAEEVR